MLLRLLVEFQQNPNLMITKLPVLVDSIVLSIVALVVALTFHEASHAWVAKRLGDPTAEQAGRISLNPLRHLHPLGTLLLLVVGFGWGRPVPIDPFKLRFGPVRGAALVGLAGPVSNLVLALLLTLPIRLGLVKWHSPFLYIEPFASADPLWVLADILGWLAGVNIILASINLVPIAPLDGSRLLGFVLPNSALPWLVRYEVVAPLVVLPLVALALILDLFTGESRILSFISPLANALTIFVTGRPLL